MGKKTCTPHAYSVVKFYYVEHNLNLIFKLKKLNDHNFMLYYNITTSSFLFPQTILTIQYCIKYYI